MPLYEFHCEDCDGVREELMTFGASKDAQIKCPNCHKKMRRVVSRPGLFLIPGHGLEGFGTQEYTDRSAHAAGNDV